MQANHRKQSRKNVGKGKANTCKANTKYKGRHKYSTSNYKELQEDGGLHKGCNTLPGMRSKHSHAVHTRGHVSHTPRMS